MMNSRFHRLLALSAAILFAQFATAAPPTIRAASGESRSSTAPVLVETTTVVAHGFTATPITPWFENMAKAILARAGGVGAVYRYDGVNGRLVRVENDGGDGSDLNIVIAFGWEGDSEFVDEGPNWGYVQAAGDAMSAMLRDAAYETPGAGPSDLVSNRAVHLIGHSRGGCLVSEAAKRLAIAGIPVDQVTTLDPHPANGTLDAPYNIDWGDPYPRHWSSTIWQDNVWRADGGGIFNGVDQDGIPVEGVHNTQLSESLLALGGYVLGHFDVHLWYHGTIDLSPNPDNGEVSISNLMRATWWPEGYDVVGFNRSAIGGGERPEIPPGIEPDPASAPLLENGHFEAGSRAGWDYHGGVGANVLGGGSAWFARLDASRPELVHNRMHVPTPPPGFCLRISFDARRASSDATDDTLKIELERWEDEAPVALPCAAWSVASLPSEFARYSVMVPAVFMCRTVRLHAEVNFSTAVESTVDLTNFAVECVLEGDLDGDGTVGGADLSGMLAAWGTLGDCLADLDGDGMVGGLDLGKLLANFGLTTPN